MNTVLLNQCSFSSKYTAKTSLSCIWDWDLHIEISLSIAIWHIQYIKMTHDTPDNSMVMHTINKYSPYCTETTILDCILALQPR